ncbi:MAG: zinc-binding dehydrogenase [Clostridia bacterium]|nr:zinc-binding dehydrogenase [Clostridia bacterium]
MKAWQLTSPKNLEHVTVSDLKRGEDQVKVKVTKALLTEADVAVYSGAIKVPSPFIPGRFAIGQITEAGEGCFLKKADRVYLAGVTEDETERYGLRIAGENGDGFYRDFVLSGIDDVYPLPPSVPDEAAFLIDAVALAERIVDEMHVTVGQHVLVVGGGLYANVLCQILLYHRAVPILADNNKERLDRAKKCGIYYTFPYDDTLQENVLKVTGGKLADAAVYLAFSNRIEPSSVFSHVARGAYVTFAAMIGKKLNVNLETAMTRNVTVKGITVWHEFISTAINILANKAVVYGEFPFKTYKEEQLPELLKEYADIFSAGGALPEVMDIVKFIF